MLFHQNLYQNRKYLHLEMINRFLQSEVKSEELEAPLKADKCVEIKYSLQFSYKSNLVYNFSCAGCNACYIGETGRHFSTRINEHLDTDKKIGDL